MRARDCYVPVWLTIEQKALLKRLARDSGVGVSQIVRDKLFGERHELQRAVQGRSCEAGEPSLGVPGEAVGVQGDEFVGIREVSSEIPLKAFRQSPRCVKESCGALGRACCDACKELNE